MVSRGYLTRVLVAVKVPPATAPERDSCKVVVGVVVVAVDCFGGDVVVVAACTGWSAAVDSIVADVARNLRRLSSTCESSSSSN